MATDLRQFLDGLKYSPCASEVLIAESEAELGGLKLPDEYVAFLRVTNGGEGCIGKNEYAIFWKAEELASLNRAYEVQKYAPGFLIFGGNGGGEAYGFDTRTEAWPIVRLPFVGMNWTEVRPMGESFAAFLKLLYEAERTRPTGTKTNLRHRP